MGVIYMVAITSYNNGGLLSRLCVLDTWKPINAKKESVFVAFSYANDIAETEQAPNQKITTKPMLAYNNITLKNGKKITNHHVLYDKDEWDKVEDVLNTEGDKPVFNGKTFKDKSGQNRVDVNSVERTDIPFNAALHKQRTLQERAKQRQTIEQRNVARQAEQARELE